MFRSTVCLIVAIASLALTGCASSVGAKHKDFADRKVKGAVVMMADPQVQFYEIGVSQQRSRRPDLEKAVKKVSQAALEKVSRETGWFRVTPMPAMAEAERYEVEQRLTLLHTNQLIYSDLREKKGSALREFDKGFEGTIGQSPVLAALAERSGAQFAVLVAGADTFTTDGAKIVGSVAAVVTLGNSPLMIGGVGVIAVGLVELKTGKVVAIGLDKTGRSLMDVDSQAKLIKNLLQDSPLGGS